MAYDSVVATSAKEASAHPRTMVCCLHIRVIGVWRRTQEGTQARTSPSVKAFGKHSWSSWGPLAGVGGRGQGGLKDRIRPNKEFSTPHPPPSPPYPLPPTPLRVPMTCWASDLCSHSLHWGLWPSLLPSSRFARRGCGADRRNCLGFRV